MDRVPRPSRGRRDFAVLRRYDFSCKNAYWDSARRAYVDTDRRLFGAVYYFRSGRRGRAAARFVELSPTFRAALHGRGLFRLGFDVGVFHRLPPLAFYLAKMFTYQAVHRRRVADLAQALPTEAVTPTAARKIRSRVARQLVEDGQNCLPSSGGYKARTATGGCGRS